MHVSKSERYPEYPSGTHFLSAVRRSRSRKARPYAVVDSTDSPLLKSKSCSFVSNELGDAFQCADWQLAGLCSLGRDSDGGCDATGLTYLDFAPLGRAVFLSGRCAIGLAFRIHLRYRYVANVSASSAAVYRSTRQPGVMLWPLRMSLELRPTQLALALVSTRAGRRDRVETRFRRGQGGSGRGPKKVMIELSVGM